MLTKYATTFLVSKFAKDERGVTMLEYSILLGIITVAAITAIVFAGGWVSTQWEGLQSTLDPTPAP
jgi:pilus assembly protein Flp/PilA